MGIKIRSMVFFSLIGMASAGDHRLTGLFRYDVLRDHSDSVTAETSVMVQSPVLQDPLMNGLYSLVVPGAGEYQTGHYTKAAVFFGAEIALIAYAIINNDKGNKKTEEFQSYAEAHWSPERYAKWINIHGSVDYGPAATIDLNKVRQYDFSEINAWESASSPNKTGFSHQLPRFRDQQYYELIGKYHQFKFGWDTYPDVNNDGVPDSDGRNYDGFIPQQLKDYAVERGKANDYFYRASFAASALVINHIVSAIDAYFTTRMINNTMLKTSMNVRPVETPEGERLLSELSIRVEF